MLLPHAGIEVLLELARCLGVLPNVHSVQLFGGDMSILSILAIAFRDQRFPSVKTVALPFYAHKILPSFCDVREVTCNGDCSSLFAPSVAQDCPQLELLHGMTMMGVDEVMKCESSMWIARSKKKIILIVFTKSFRIQRRTSVTCRCTSRRNMERHRSVLYSSSCPHD